MHLEDFQVEAAHLESVPGTPFRDCLAGLGGKLGGVSFGQAAGSV